jgi:hypothetical protein
MDLQQVGKLSLCESAGVDLLSQGTPDRHLDLGLANLLGGKPEVFEYVAGGDVLGSIQSACV